MTVMTFLMSSQQATKKPSKYLSQQMSISKAKIFTTWLHFLFPDLKSLFESLNIMTEKKLETWMKVINKQ